MEAEEDDSSRELPQPATVVDSCRQEGACEGGVEFSAVSPVRDEPVIGTRVRGADMTVAEVGFGCGNDIEMREGEGTVDVGGSGEFHEDAGGGDEIDVEEDKMGGNVGGRGQFRVGVERVCEGAADDVELLESADVTEAVAGDTDVTTVAELEGIRSGGGYDDGNGIEMKEDVVEGGELIGPVVGICDEAVENAELMESARIEEANVVVVDGTEGEEDGGVGGDREEVIGDGGIDSEMVVESQGAVVASDVDDSGVSKEEDVSAMVIEEDRSGLAAVVKEKEEEALVDVGFCDVRMDEKVIDTDKTENTGIRELLPNVESTSGAVVFAVTESEIADSKADICLTESERVTMTGGDGESNAVVGMVDEIPLGGKDIGVMDAGINAVANVAAETNERETVDPIMVREEKGQDDVTIKADETNGIGNMDIIEGTDRKELTDVRAQIDVVTDEKEWEDYATGVRGKMSDDATNEADETNGMENMDFIEGTNKEAGYVVAEIDVEADEKEQADAATGVRGMLSDDATFEADETNGMENMDRTEVADTKARGDVRAKIEVEAADEKEQDEAAAGAVDKSPDDVTIEADEKNGMSNMDSTEDGDRQGIGDVGGVIDVEADDAEEDNILEDREMDDVVGETEVTDHEDKPEETDATGDTDIAEDEMEKAGLRRANVVLNRKGGKRGGRASSRKKLEEDVCFICFDGGDLVLCDRRGCPKVYHPSCVNRDEAFFQTKGQWNCGWHLCSSCKKNAHYLCYTCTFSLCKGCVKDSTIYVVRGNKGFCDICMRTVRMIENVIQGDNSMDQADFDDKTSWEYLFKDYYMDLKGKLSISAAEIEGAKNPWKGADSLKQDFQDDAYDEVLGSDDSAGQSEGSLPKKRKAGKRVKSQIKERKLPRRSNRVNVTDLSRTDDGVQWATKELLDFVMHMKDGDGSVLSQFNVQELLLEYIKTNKLRDPRKKSQIICDSRLQSLFGKPRVGHFEMLKLLESHFLIKDDVGDLQEGVVDVDVNQTDADRDTDISRKAGKQKKRKTRKRGDDRVLQSNFDDYAAIDVHNITLIYLRRSLVEDLLEYTETFDDKVIGSFVRIRIPGNNPKQEMYRLVPIIGTSKVSKPYKVGKKFTDYVLEIQNLGKPETIQIDIISNQEFTQDECLRLRQSIKYGVTNRLTVGDIQEKAIALQEVRVKDWLDAEVVRLSHLRDRASEKGHQKELRECVEKLQLLKTPQERQRRLNEVPEIHADPKMDPDNESDDDEDFPIRGRSNSSGGGKSREPISPSKGVSSLNDSWSGLRTHSSGNRELTRSMSSKGIENWSDDGIRAVGDGVNQNMYMQPRERELSSEVGAGITNARLKIEASSKVAPETTVSLAAGALESADKVNESEKIWHYKDPSGKIQGPFSVVQLRKWNDTGYFPVDLKIWRASETKDDSLLLSDALKGKFLRPKSVVTAPAVQSQYSSLLYGANQNLMTQKSEPIGSHIVHKVPPSVEIPKISTSRWSSGTNLLSPTPYQTSPSIIKGPVDEGKWSSAMAIANSSVAAPSSIPSLANTGGITGADFLHNVSTVLSQDPNMLMNAASALLAQSQSALPVQQRSNVEVHVQNAQPSDIRNPGSTFQNLVQAVQSHAAPVQGWGSVPAPPEPNGSAPSQRSGQWGEPPVQNPASYATPSSGGAYSNHWRPNSGDQSNLQSVAAPSTIWGINNATNVFGAVPAANSQQQPKPNTNWMQAPRNMGWAGSAPGNSNINWSGNASAGIPGQGRPQGSGSMPGWNVPPTQAPPAQNSSFGWSGPGNRGGWMGDKNHSDGRHRERGDTGYGGGRPWNRQSSFGAGGDGGRDQGLCWFQDEYGNCRRGASCKFRHGSGNSGT
ncbi:hypothetical protein MLD38_023013 [Melastoma candidum]|uniref:Uncharacterized protein n=1 Tax=Melastoma candidum TaxID=119954 RepID=A0ACB9QMC8_9MYRT|nr:hypothetical protein MLD38_023013 [Melastoma candidum]